MRFILATMCLCFMGCAGCAERERLVQYSNVKQLLMHETNHYSLVITDENNGAEIIDLEGFHGQNTIKIYFDVPDHKDQWAKIDFYTPPLGDDNEKVRQGEVHLHYNSKINGAGWDHGKFGKGQTVEVE